jgi:large subunit ribosomal protein L13Ae
MSGNFYRNKMKYLDFLRKRCNVKPSRGPVHVRAPSKIFWRTVRGMTPHKTERGKTALKRLQCFEGVPPPYDKKKKMVIPSALKVLRLKHGRRFCSLGRLGHEVSRLATHFLSALFHSALQVGWKYQDIVAALEAKRKVKGEAFHKGKLEVAKARDACMKDKKVAKAIAPHQAIIESYGHQ